MKVEFEDLIVCLDCGIDITENRKWKGLDKFGINFKPLRYCESCIKKMKSDGYFLRDGQKTSMAIEQLTNESIHASEQTARNQYF